MSSHQVFHQTDTGPTVDAIAVRALSVVATHAQRKPSNVNSATSQVDLKVQDHLLRALTHPDAHSFKEAVLQSVRDGMQMCDIANLHVPALARDLGAAWLEDRLGFATVSIGSARLQNFLWKYGMDWNAARLHTEPPVASVLVAVPEFEQHTLGATLLTAQLRAQNIDATLILNASDDMIASQANRKDFDMIMLSSAQTKTLALYYIAVQKLRKNSVCPPIVIGGHVTNECPDVLTQVGADYCANCWEDALNIVRKLDSRKDAGFIGNVG